MNTQRRLTILFAGAAASLAVLTLCYGDDSIVGQSVAAELHSPQTVLYGSALLLLLFSFGLCFSPAVLMSICAIGAWLSAWALVCLLPIVANPLNFLPWYSFSEASSAVAGAWLLYLMLRYSPSHRWSSGRVTKARRWGQILFGVTCMYYGVSHLLYSQYTAGLVPRWLPLPLAIAYLTGVAHLAAGTAICVGIVARTAAFFEALMMTLFGMLVWVPSFFASPRPIWASHPATQWSELVVNILLAASAWIVATSFSMRWSIGAAQIASNRSA
jgi:uncharacterized membrane protein YphA (DoxX/SURF4 family)